ncbi:MAG: transglutaminase domain-containing protein [Oscillospiraceae bacterium]|nr:transglutaminase domain-containing protein [Oscillospiraceae bacterium]
MKRERLWNGLLAFGLSWMLSAAAVGCMVTGFGLEVEREGALMVLCAGASFLAALCFSFRRGEWVLAGLAALAAGYLWRRGTLLEHLAALLRSLTQRYHNAYGWGILGIRGCDGTGPTDQALWIVAVLAAVAVSWVAARRKNVLWAMPAVILPLVSCVIVTDTVPDTLWLYLLMLGVVVLLLTDHVRRKGKGRTVFMTLYALVPAAAALGMLFLLVPRDSYVNRAEQYEERLRAWTSRFTDQAAEAAKDITARITGEPSPETVDLSRVGPQSQWDTVVLEVRSTQGGRVYLREQDYDTYDGTGWTASIQRTEQFGGGTEVGTVTISTRGRRSRLLIPYYPVEGQPITGGSAGNGDGLTEYTYSVAEVPEVRGGAVIPKEALSSGASTGGYLQLPGETAQWAEERAEWITWGITVDEFRADAIADYVRNSARYDLKTARMPSERTDFARWFLEESDTGYCVHFATAAVVLLRGAGIPARYVTGYVADCQPGQTVEVPEKAAHAWAEYYDTDRGAWVVLEATPADEDDETETAAPTAEATEGPRPTAEPESQATVPPETAGEETPQMPEERFSGHWSALLWLLGGALLLPGQSLLRQAVRKRRWDRGGANERALARWGQVCRVAGLLKLEEPEPLRELAEKARYSRHTLTREELEAFDLWWGDAMARLRRENTLRRLYMGLVHALW